MNDSNFNYNENNMDNYNNPNEVNNQNAPKISKGFLALGLVVCLIGIVGLCMFLVKSIEDDHKEKNKEEEKEDTFKKEDYDELTIKKTELYEIMNDYIIATSAGVNNGVYGDLSDPNVLYYIPVSDIDTNTCVEIENGKNPLGDWGEAYVVVNYSPSQYTYDYYFTFYTNNGYSLPLTKHKQLSKTGDDIVVNGGTNKETISSQSIDTVSSIYVIKKDPSEILTCYVR